MKFLQIDFKFEQPLAPAIIGGVSLAALSKYFGASFAAGGLEKSEDENFVYVPVRALSACIVGGNSWKASDFSTPGVLKKSLALLKNKPVFTNHNLWDVNSTVGVIVATQYGAAYKMDDGTEVPEGIDCLIRVSKKNNPKIADGLMADPPEFQSFSVSVLYKYKPSHSFTDGEGNEDEYKFDRMIGQMIDGQMVRRIATEIVDYIELSLVSIGADPFAKIKTAEGKIISVDRGAVTSCSADFNETDQVVALYKESGQIFFSGNDQTPLHLTRFSAVPATDPNDDAMLKAHFAQLLGVTENEVTPELLSQYSIVKTSDLQTLTANGERIETLTAEVATEKNKVVALNSKITTLEATIAANKTKLADFERVRTETLQARKGAILSAYLKVSNNTGEEAFRQVLESADESALDKFEKDYKIAGLEKFGKPKCNSCGSTNFSLQQSEGNPGGTEGEKAEIHLGQQFIGA